MSQTHQIFGGASHTHMQIFRIVQSANWLTNWVHTYAGVSMEISDKTSHLSCGPISLLTELKTQYIHKSDENVLKPKNTLWVADMRIMWKLSDTRETEWDIWWGYAYCNCTWTRVQMLFACQRTHSLLMCLHSLSLHLLMQARKHNSRHPNRLREVGYHKRLRQCVSGCLVIHGWVDWDNGPVGATPSTP